MTPEDLGGYKGETVRYDFINQEVVTGSECSAGSPLRHRARDSNRPGEKQRHAVRDKERGNGSEGTTSRQGGDESLARQSILHELDRESSCSSSQEETDALECDLHMKKKSTPSKGRAERGRGGLFLSNTVVPLNESCKHTSDRVGVNPMMDPQALLKRKRPSKPALNVPTNSFTDISERDDEGKGGQEFKLDGEVKSKKKSRSKLAGKNGNNSQNEKYLLSVSGPCDRSGSGQGGRGMSGADGSVPPIPKSYSLRPQGTWGFWGLFRQNMEKVKEREKGRDRDRVGLLEGSDESSSSDSDCDSDSDAEAASGMEMKSLKHCILTSDLPHLNTQRNGNGNLSALETMANSPVSTGEKKPDWAGVGTEGAVQRRLHSPDKRRGSEEEEEVEVESSEEQSTMQGIQRRRGRDKGRERGTERERKSRFRPGSADQVNREHSTDDGEYAAQIDKKVSAAFRQWGGVSNAAETAEEKEEDEGTEVEREGGGSNSSLSPSDLEEYSMSLTAPSHSHRSKENPHAIFAT
jgi:hypothetical protein